MTDGSFTRVEEPDTFDLRIARYPRSSDIVARTPAR
jgi:hypothetical protein